MIGSRSIQYRYASTIIRVGGRHRGVAWCYHLAELQWLAPGLWVGIPPTLKFLLSYKPAQLFVCQKKQIADIRHATKHTELQGWWNSVGQCGPDGLIGIWTNQSRNIHTFLPICTCSYHAACNSSLHDTGIYGHGGA